MTESQNNEALTPQAIQDKVNHILVEGFEIEADLLSPEARLEEDLDMDSLDGVDLVVALDKAFDCRIQEEDARSMRTMQDIYTFIEKTIREKNTGE